jgi:hypothetical protein
MVSIGTARVEQLDRMLVKLVELGVDKRWLTEAKPDSRQASQLLKGILYLKGMYPEFFRDQ